MREIASLLLFVAQQAKLASKHYFLQQMYKSERHKELERNCRIGDVTKIGEIMTTAPVTLLFCHNKKFGRTPFAYACRFDHVQVVEYFCSILPHEQLQEIVKQVSENGYNCLHECARNGCLNTINYLLKVCDLSTVQAALAQKTNTNKHTPLQVAARNANDVAHAIIQYMISMGCHTQLVQLLFDDLSAKKQNACMIACEEEGAPLTALCIEIGLQERTYTGLYPALILKDSAQCSIMHYMAYAEHDSLLSLFVTLVEQMAKHNKDIQALLHMRDKMGNTCLHGAFQSNSPKLSQYILQVEQTRQPHEQQPTDFGCLLNEQNKHGYTPLMLAAYEAKMDPMLHIDKYQVAQVDWTLRDYVSKKTALQLCREIYQPIVLQLMAKTQE